MLSKEQFCKYVDTYREYQKYLDELDAYFVKIWEHDSVGKLTEYYVAMISDLMGCAPDKLNGTVVENFLFDSTYTEEDTEEFYDDFIKDNPKISLSYLNADTLLQLMMVSKDISPEVIQKTFDLEEPFTKIAFTNKVIFEYNGETKKWEFIERG